MTGQGGYFWWLPLWLFLVATTLGDVLMADAFEVDRMARRGRIYQWRNEEVEEVTLAGASGSTRPRRSAAPPKPAKLGFQNGLLLFIICSVIMVFAVPALIAVLCVIYAVIFGE
ncbi:MULTISPECIES: hypothetical protein [Pseudomonas]|uniref:hypothetical protein n=1 Tax=Pseudomonas TaxID=286 RepID=UPI000CD50C35|nr:MULTISPECIES: hypothetical protein [Pseudomonas]RBH54201.1 hypothetical protein C3F00_024495 [Pseudomonas sp. MWU13-2860]